MVEVLIVRRIRGETTYIRDTKHFNDLSEAMEFAYEYNAHLDILQCESWYDFAAVVPQKEST